MKHIVKINRNGIIQEIILDEEGYKKYELKKAIVFEDDGEIITDKPCTYKVNTMEA